MPRFLKILDSIIEIGWLAIFFLGPIFFCPWVYSVWQIGEYFLFQVLAEIILFAWLAKITLKMRIPAKEVLPDAKNFHTKSVLILPAIIFIALLGLATIFSLSPYTSFWGSYSRKMGWLVWFHFFVFFLVLFFNLKTKAQVARIFYTILAAVIIVVIYGFLQIFGIDFFPWVEPAFFTGRIFSTLGQPNFLASWLLLTAPIIVWAILRVRFLRGLIVFLFLGSIFALVLTQSRGGWLGFFVAFFFFNIIFALSQRKKRLGVLLVILFGIIIGFTVYFNFFPLTVTPDEPFLVARLKTFTYLAKTGKLRLIWWQNSLDLIKRRPFLGYGPEIQRFLFAKYYRPELATLERINTYPDRAHNDILDTLLASGTLGLASYLFLIGGVFYLGLRYVFKNLESQNSKDEITVLLTGLIGYLVSIQFSFHVIPTAIYFWGYLAIILNLISQNYPKLDMNPKNETSKSKTDWKITNNHL